MSNNNNTPTNHNPQMGVPGNYQNQNLMQPFVPNMQQPQPPFMNVPNQLQMSHMGGLVPQNNGNFNPMFPVHGQVMHNVTPQMNMSQFQGQILAQNIMNMLQQPHMNMPNGQFCAPYPMQNMNQQLNMQMQNPSQGVPYGLNHGPNPPYGLQNGPNPSYGLQNGPNPPNGLHHGPNPPNGLHQGPNPMFGFPNQVHQAMVPQNPMFSGNPQFGIVPGNQVRPPIDPKGKNQVATNGNTSGFVSGGPSQQFQGNNSSVPYNTNNAQSSTFRNSHSQENPKSNINTNFANSNWKGSPSNNFKNKQNRGGSNGGFQKSKFHDNNNGNRRTGFPKDHKGKGHFGSTSEELQQQPERSFSAIYSEQEIQQWREARRKNHPSRVKLEKKHGKQSKDSKVIDREVLQRELKEVLAKQAELGVEVAEIPSHYLKNAANQVLQSEEVGTSSQNRNSNRRNRNSNRRNRNGKKQKFDDNKLLENKKQSLLQKLLSADIKRDKSHLLQVFRFMIANSFFKDYPDNPLIYPSVMVKEMGSEVVYDGKDVENEDSDEDDNEEEWEFVE